MKSIKTILIFGASGSGSTTLAKAVEQQFGYHFIDTDDAIWEDTDPPFSVRKPFETSLRYVQTAMNGHETNVISGSFIGWGEPLKEQVDLYVYMHLPVDVRLERIQKREINRFGKRVLLGGDLYLQHLDFLDWVSRYEETDETHRGQKQHLKWLEDVKRPIVRITQPMSIEELLAKLAPFLNEEVDA
ncbi:MAG: AAA family ATPase [Candidatus Izemoplasmatales bacterium]